MTDLKIAVSRTCPNCFSTQRNIVNTSETNFIDVAAVVLTPKISNAVNSMS